MKILPLETLHKTPEDITSDLTANKDLTIMLEQDGKSKIVILSASNYAKLLEMSAICGCSADQRTADTDLLSDAMTIFIEKGIASAALLQKQLRLGYAKAEQIMTELEELGAIGPKNGIKPREVLIADLSEFCKNAERD